MGETLKSTKQREAIFAVLAKASEPRSAAEIYSELQKSGHEMALSTVYRTLTAMEENALIEKLSLFNPSPVAVYILRQEEHLHYAICASCKRQFPIPGCPLEQMEEEVSEELGFLITSHQIVLYGYCKDCQIKYS